MLGIPFLDVLRVLAAVLLLGNVHFTDNAEGNAEPNGEVEPIARSNFLRKNVYTPLPHYSNFRHTPYG